MSNNYSEGYGILSKSFRYKQPVKLEKIMKIYLRIKKINRILNDNNK